MTSAQEIIKKLGLKPHPEGGHYVQTFRDEKDEKVCSTAIYYLLQKGERSHWHRVHGSAEIWHYYAGDPLNLLISANAVKINTQKLGPHVLNKETPQIIVPSGHWQSAECNGEWTLAGCTVAPGFEFENFEMAAPGWQPGQDK